MTVRKRLVGMAFGGFVAGALVLWASPGEGVTTRTFTLDTSSELSAGVLDRVSVTADGQVVLGGDTQRVAPPDIVGSVWSLLDLGDGAVLAGTGVDGRVYRIQNGAATLYAQTDALVVTSLVRGDDNAIYAGTLPDGKLYKLVAPVNGQVQAPTLVSTLPGAQHIWAVAWDATRRALLCATGPEGKLYAVDPRAPAENNATVVFDSEEPHLYTMTRGAGGAVYLGAGGGHAVVYAWRGPGQARVVARLAGDEVKGIAVVGEDLVAASNEFTDPPEAPRRPLASNRAPSPGGTGGARPRAGKGNLYRIRPSGLTERIYNNTDAHITALQWDERRREALIALGTGGRVIAVAEDRTSRVAYDVDETQVTALALFGRTPVFATSDTGAFYLLSTATPTAATWNSKVLDGTAPSHWGAVRWRGAGALDWETRSGNTDTPDATWSEWQALDPDGVIRSPSSRYVQVRARFGRDPATVIRAVTVYYQPENQRAVLTEVTATPPETKIGETRASVVKLGWRVDNPDSDTLRYRLRYRADNEQTWRPVLRNQDYVTGTSADWPTDGLPEGYYRVEVEASDEVSNADTDTARDRRVSEPVLVDNTPPTVTVRVAGANAQGEANDGASSIVRVEVSVDGGEWRQVRATDGVLDERTEAFSTALPTVGAGEHVVSVRVYDEANNLGVASARFRR